MITAQQLEYVRINLIHALADHSCGSKGQLVAFFENSMFIATARSRGRQKLADPATGRMVNPSNPPIPGQQSCAKSSSIALVSPVEFSTASWRRAVLALEEHQKSWLLWNYSENISFEFQVSITQWAWAEFKSKLGVHKMASKTMERLRALIWLAAQTVKSDIKNGETPPSKWLAGLVEVSVTNWSQNYAEHWEAMLRLFRCLDADSLKAVARSRSQQKAANYQPSIAEMN